MAEVIALMPERREELKALEKLFREMEGTLGGESAVRVLGEAIAAESRAAGRKALPGPESEPNLAHFASVFSRRGGDGGIEGISWEICGDTLTVEVKRCDYCSLYASSNLPKSISHALGCGREARFAEGYDPRIILVKQEHCTGNDRACRLVFAWNPDADYTPGNPKTSLRVRNN